MAEVLSMLRGLQSLLLRPLRFVRYPASYPGRIGGFPPPVSVCGLGTKLEGTQPVFSGREGICQVCKSHRAALQVRSVSSVTNSQPQHQDAPAQEFYGCMRQIKTSPMKLNLVAKLIRGMRLSEALAQMEFSQKKPARFVQMTLLDTQRRAVHNHDVEPLNLWVAESYVGKGQYLKRLRYHGKGMSGVMHKYYAHYFLKLCEGPPPPKKKRRIEDHKSRKTKKLIEEGPRGIPNAL